MRNKSSRQYWAQTVMSTQGHLPKPSCLPRSLDLWSEGHLQRSVKTFLGFLSIILMSSSLHTKLQSKQKQTKSTYPHLCFFSLEAAYCLLHSQAENILSTSTPCSFLVQKQMMIFGHYAWHRIPPWSEGMSPSLWVFYNFITSGIFILILYILLLSFIWEECIWETLS